VIFVTFYFLQIYRNMFHFWFCYNLTKLSATSHEDLCTFMKISRSIFPSIRHISDKSADKMKTQILCSMSFFFEKRTLYETMRKNMV